MTIVSDPAPSTITSAAEFRVRVARNSALMQYGGIFLAVAVLFVVRNVVVTLMSLDKNPGVSFGELLFVTTGEDGKPSGSLAAITYGPFVALPIALLLMLLAAVTSRPWAARTFDAFARRGWIADQVRIGIRPSGRAKNQELVVLTHPGFSREDAERAIAAWSTRMDAASTDRKSMARRLLARAKKSGSVGDLVPELPPTAILSATTTADHRVVVIAEPNASAAKVLALKG